MGWRGEQAREKYRKKAAVEHNIFRLSAAERGMLNRECRIKQKKAEAFRMLIAEEGLDMKDILSREDFAKVACMANSDEFNPENGAHYLYNMRFAGYDELKKTAQSDELTASIKATLAEAFQAFSMPKVKSDEELKARIGEYFQTCIERASVPTFEEVALYCGYTVATFRRWERKTASGFSSETGEIIAKLRTVLHDYDAKMAMAGKSNPVMYIFRSKNYYDMQDKVEQVITTNFESDSTFSEDDIAARYKDMGEVEPNDSDERLSQTTLPNDSESSDFPERLSQATFPSDFDRPCAQLPETYTTTGGGKRLENDIAWYAEHPELKPVGWDGELYKKLLDDMKNKDE